ncbi:MULTISPECIES: MarR family winged helix-turn-helix transcriptional regulator [Novosphingobium]|uniref:MarR family transcriptional regulator n=1 Tax=Novosphingobium subterraneum TaxID=48936 RepID=A0A0B9AHN0_9SPHN|nr:MULTISPECIES: MarR family transcriptional regulator [Novosphingobium]KHS48821.1 MarR family transcriptional regulator [Novosphingobium subterraneum]QOV93423.1 MarR family transcriptional regulator [Novosphingobium sp. ES2-1]
MIKDKFADAIAPVGHTDEDDVGAINDILGFHIRLAHGACLRHFTETFTDLDLTQKQVSVLWLVDDHPGIAQTDLAQRLRMDRATTMAIINRLQAKHFLRRDRSPRDGRKQALFLEPAGVEMLARAKQAIGEHEAWVKSRFTDKEVRQLIELLSRIHE